MFTKTLFTRLQKTAQFLTQKWLVFHKWFSMAQASWVILVPISPSVALDFLLTK